MDINEFENGKKKKNVKKKIIILLLVCALLASSVYIGMNLVNNQADSENVIQEVVVDKTKVTETKTERMLLVEKLQKENPDVVGYIEIEGTSVSYPVVQAKDNDYYMRRTYQKKKSIYGSLFVDYRYDSKKPSTNMMIYGHNIGNGKNKMFEELLQYQKEAYYKKHPIIKFTTATEEATYEIIAAFRSRLYMNTDKGVFRYYYFFDAANEKEFNDYVNNSIKACKYKTGKTAKYGDELMTLSTCTYYEEDGRFAVVARKVK